MGVILLVSILDLLAATAAASKNIPVVRQPRSSAGALQSPTLTIEPRYSEYFEGERVALICSASQNETVEGYSFFNQDGQQILKMPANHFQKGKLMFKTRMNSTGDYSCNYWMEKAGTELTSAQSDSVSLRVTEAPAAPSLSLNPQLHDYSLGDSISLVCSAPPEEKRVEEFQYYGDHLSISAMVSYDSKYMYNMSILEAKHVGLFRCAYVLQHSGRSITSKQSNAVFIDGTGVRWARILAVGGFFFTINGLIFLIFSCRYRNTND